MVSRPRPTARLADAGSPLLLQLRHVADSTPALLSYVDAGRRYRFCNRAYEQWFGRPSAEIVGRTMLEVLGAEAAAAIEPYVERALAGHPVRFERAVPYRDGGVRVVDATYTPDLGPRAEVRGFAVLVNDITESRRRDEALHHAETFRLAMLATSDAVWDWDVAGLRLEWNNQLEVLFGHRPTSEAGSRTWWEGRIHPDDRARVVASMDAALRPGAPSRWEAEYRFARADGRWAHVADRALVLRDAGGRGVRMLGAMQDVTAEREAAEARALASALFGDAPVGLAVLDADLRYLRVNPQLAELNAVPVEAHLGRTVREVIPALAPQLEPRLRSVLASGQRLAFDVEAGEPGGTGPRRHFRADYFPVHGAAEAVVGVGVAVTDVTDIRRAEEALRETAEFRERFMSIVSHDLRNSLYAVTVAAQAITSHPDASGTVVQTGRRILRSAADMRQLLTDLLDYARTRDAGGIPVRLRPVRLQEVCANVLDALREAWPGRTLLLSAEGGTEGRWDAGRLAQVVQNLVVNALKHGDASAPVQVRLAGAPDAVVLEVENAGRPIPTELLPHLFAAFRRGGGDGLGLGLYIADQVVRAHGGALGVVRSDAVRGTLFRARLPR